VKATVLHLHFGLQLRRSVARSSGAVVAAALSVGGRVTHCNEGPAITHTQPTAQYLSLWPGPNPPRILIRAVRSRNTDGI
jgi:hypothetical protein